MSLFDRADRILQGDSPSRLILLVADGVLALALTGMLIGGGLAFAVMEMQQ